MAASGLDLRAVERFIQHREELRRPIDGTLDMVVALLAHCRALRAVLGEFLTPDYAGSERYKRAAVVLGAAQDGEGGP